VRRVTSGLGNAQDARADEAPVPIGARLTPAEHWTPQDGQVAPAIGTAAAATVRPGAGRRAPWLDRLLLAIEVVAIAGLLVALVQSFGLVRRLQQEVRAGPTGLPAPATRQASAVARVSVTVALGATGRPTASPPAAAIRSPTSSGATPSLPATATPGPSATPRATPDSPTGVRFVIPKIRVDAPMVQGDSWETLKSGIGHRIGSAWPGEQGNVVISAHNDVYGSIFKDLGKLRPGDPVFAQTPTGEYRYEVVSSRIVLPTEISVTQPTDQPVLTLITCYPPYVDTHRIVVTARLVQ
jgi:sortase A